MRNRAAATTAVLAAAVLVSACAASGAEATGPGAGRTPSETTVASPEPGPYEQPPLAELPIDAPDRPGDDLVDWRRQVRESVLRYPGTFAVPVDLPSDVSLAFTSPWSGHPVLDVMSEGSGVVVCRDEPPACEAALGDAPVVVVRSGVVDSGPFSVLRKPPAQPSTTGALTPAQQEFWSTVAFTTAVPAWAADAE
jgi:hypothetical protein